MYFQLESKIVSIYLSHIQCKGRVEAPALPFTGNIVKRCKSSEFFEVFWDIFNLSRNFADMIELAQHIETLLL